PVKLQIMFSSTSQSDVKVYFTKGANVSFISIPSEISTGKLEKLRYI
ncbi:MAG: hypothetical protein IAE98_04805, partial [Candidatus Kapabacteria bacterium]|nr:hypothetical protein [Candidatus Kapabacteria bacterium]